ncbi:fasciculation and elongation protein zeta-2-like isoform X2 [Branchiostoma floridae]|uniref:Fasciculation and elongation protein zeta-2-like isoform X2 n=1 Tax=Branchiostoma floridae TaxID=7739 RepID=A0A9J7L789_BRAFL|nr:fasciculation and elongation protein zeta-2-like isoform X2 [Branchiostoma floridae]
MEQESGSTIGAALPAPGMTSSCPAPPGLPPGPEMQWLVPNLHAGSGSPTMMESFKMAAPLAQIDDEWLDFTSPSDVVNSNDTTSSCTDDNQDVDNVDNCGFGVVSFKSMEDLVHEFDETLNICFRNYNAKTDSIAPVKVLSQEEIMENSELWQGLTDNFANVLPVDWNSSYTRQLYNKALNLNEQKREEPMNLDLSDDEELRESFDAHSLIISSLTQEPIFTAEEVIEEIDEIMGETSMEEETPVSEDSLSVLSQEMLALRERSNTVTSYDESKAAEGPPGETALHFTPAHFNQSPAAAKCLKKLPLQTLNEVLEELEATIKEYSEILIQQLALRDELVYEKEVKNQFISALVAVQNRQREHKQNKDNKKKRKKVKGGNGTEPGTPEMSVREFAAHSPFLYTVIPYEKKNSPMTAEDLQILTKILVAMSEDSDKVPSLLTDYILKVLCPSQDMMVPT